MFLGNTQPAGEERVGSGSDKMPDLLTYSVGSVHSRTSSVNTGFPGTFIETKGTIVIGAAPATRL